MKKSNKNRSILLVEKITQCLQMEQYQGKRTQKKEEGKISQIDSRKK